MSATADGTDYPDHMNQASIRHRRLAIRSLLFSQFLLLCILLLLWWQTVERSRRLSQMEQTLVELQEQIDQARESLEQVRAATAER